MNGGAHRPPKPGRRPKVALIATAGLAASGAGAWALAARGEGPSAPAANDAIPTAAATVARRDLVDREDVEGTLGFAGRPAVAAAEGGTLTRLRPEGARVPRGRSLFSVDGRAVAYVLYGDVPMYRDLHAGVADGPDVRQLERNLAALGFAINTNRGQTPDGHWDAATTAAVRRWQRARGVTRDGVVRRADVVFTGGAVRVGEHRLAVGDPVRPGAPVTGLTSTRRLVTARLDAARQSAVHRGDAVSVTLPDGRVVAGGVTRVGRVARAGQDGAAATVELRVALRGRRAGAGLDGAPVTVSVAVGRTRDALSVPVTALVATAAGRYAVEIVGRSGARHLVGVTTGAYAGGYVQVAGRLRAGTRVVVPR
ncbi:MAG TPA: peptidoglycan-binding protein [Solirubrobacteraceae bacterium]